ncbi:MAG: TrmO family methyltransferase [Halochromatium sp.]|uniref:TrmO family methyltransferase domain-containing protein n=1 Tax=Halochromatium sp. TaxID=2049430 RepID=UPI00397BBC5E
MTWSCNAREDAISPSAPFALRSTVRPNPIGSSLVTLIGIEGRMLRVRGLDCLDGTPLLDLKPARSAFMTTHSGA